jgi:hypothetical protein
MARSAMNARVGRLWTAFREWLKQLPISARIAIGGALIVAVFFSLVLILCVAENAGLSTVPAANFWILIFARLPPSMPYPATAFAFSLSVVLGVVLNLGPFGATLTVIYLYLVRPLINLGKAEAMQVTHYNDQRDRIIIGAIYRLCREGVPPDQREKIMAIVEAGFQIGKEEMDKEFLPIPYGERGAREVLRRLHEIDLG